LSEAEKKAPPSVQAVAGAVAQRAGRINDE